MAVNYTDLFENLGEFVQRVNDFQALYAALDTDFAEIEADLDANAMQDVLSGTFETISGFKGNLLGWIGAMQIKTTQLLVHRETVLEELNIQSADVRTVLVEMYRDMTANTQHVKRSTVTVGAVTELKTNANAGTLLVNKVLDGVTQPHGSFPAVWEYNGADSELAGTSETIWAQCIRDSESDGATEGGETFQVNGQVAPSSPFSWQAFGSGAGPSLTVLQGASIMSNLEMENFTANIPSGWTLDAGTAGTQVLNETSTIKRGSSALRFTGNASVASIQVSQNAPSSFKPRKRYYVGFWLRGTAGASAGTFTIQFEGTGYTAASSEKITLNAAAVAALTSYAWHGFYINWPTDVPSDMELVIKWTGTPSAHSVYIDGGGVAPVVYHNGVNFVVYAGSEKFLRTDRFSLTVSNDDLGVFQTFFRKSYGVQLPSNAAPSQADTLAT